MLFKISIPAGVLLAALLISCGKSGPQFPDVAPPTITVTATYPGE
jgi:multidrug efflux pump subunit AcrB